MIKAATLAVFTLAALPLLAAAEQQTVWRCGAHGNSYSSTPCAEGRSIDVPGARPAGDVQAALTLAARERQSADQLQRERLRSEAQNRGTGFTGLPLVKPKVEAAPATAAPRRHRKTRLAASDPGTWRAVAPASR